MAAPLCSRSIPRCMYGIHSHAPDGSSAFRRMTQLEIRRTGLSSLNLFKQRAGHVSDSKHDPTRRLAESLKKPFLPLGDVVAATEDNERILDHRKVLKIFRVDRKKLA